MCLAQNKASCSVNCGQQYAQFRKCRKRRTLTWTVPIKMYGKTKPATSPLGVVQCRCLTVTWMIMCYEWGSDVVI